jgi:hypothetical protein
MRVRKALSSEELEAIEAPLRAEYRAKYPDALAGLGGSVRKVQQSPLRRMVMVCG